MATHRHAQWREISRYLDEALDLDEAARDDWLRELDVRAPAVSQAVRALIGEMASLARTPLVLDTHAIALPRMGLAGQQLGAYTLESVLGHGGMGTVWLARRSDGRYEGRAAVKLLNAALLGRPAEQRFVREGSVLAKLRHPNIAHLIDAGVAPSGQPYLVIEYVEGAHIDRYSEQNRLGVDARVRLFLDVLAAVAHAHSHLVVHRDIKPSNILVTPDGAVKLLDFGIASLLGSGDAGLTREVDAGLTPAYAAPEQLLNQPITTATDVYALGLVLYLLLAGRPPFDAVGASVAELARATLDRDAPRPSTCAGDPVSRRMLRGDLDNIVLKALRKNPEERYHAGEALARDLRNYLACQPVSARPDSVAYRAGKFVRRHRVPVALAALALLALLAGLAGTLIESRRANSQRDFALRQLARAEAINDLNALLLADAAPMGKTFTARDLLTRAERIVARQVDDPDGSRLGSLVAIGRLYVMLGETGEANRVLEQAYEQSRATTDPSLRAIASCELARATLRTGDVVRARQLLEQGLGELPNQSQYMLTRVLCHLCGVGLENWARDGERAIAHARAAETLAAESGASSPLLELRIAMEVAEAHRVAGRFPAANELFSDAYNRLKALGREDTERASILLNNWALVLRSLGRPRESERMLRRSVEISSADGSDALVEPIVWTNLADALFDLGRYAEGLELATRAYSEALAEGDALAADQALLRRARLHLASGEIDRGAALLAEAESQFQKRFPPTHPAFVAIAMDRIRIPESRGDLRQAESLADRAIAMAEGDSPRSSSLPALLTRRAEIRLKMRRFAEARADAERSIDLARERLAAGSLSAGIGIAYVTLGEAHAGEGRLADARATFTAALEHLEPTAGLDHPAARRARALLEQGE